MHIFARQCLKNAVFIDRVLICGKCEEIIAWLMPNGEIHVFDKFKKHVDEIRRLIPCDDNEQLFERELKLEVNSIIHAVPDWGEEDFDDSEGDVIE